MSVVPSALFEIVDALTTRGGILSFRDLCFRTRNLSTVMNSKLLSLAVAVLGCVTPPALAFQQESGSSSGDVASVASPAQDSTVSGILYPIDVAADSNGTIYVADRNLPGIWKIVEGKPEIYFQAEKKFRTPLNAIRCLAVDDQNRLYAGCSTTTEIYRFEDGKPVPLSDGKVSVPMNMMIDGDSVVVCDLKMRMLDVVPAAGGELKELAEIQGAKAVAKLGQQYLVLTGLENSILSVDPATGASAPWVKGRPFNFPADLVAIDSDTVVVSDSYENCLWKVVDGKATKWVEDERFSNPVGLCLQGDRVILVDSRANTVFSIDKDGTVEVVWQGTPTP